jgi:murein DD-endopeptidase MepM/ murein hydrolase activator NlpD
MPRTITIAPGSVHRTLKVDSPSLEGADVSELQKALNLRLKARGLGPIAVDGDYGPTTHQAALDVAWFLGIGPAAAASQPLTAFKQRLIRNPRQRNTTQLDRARKRKGKGKLPPGSVARPLPTRAGAGSEFSLVDAEGAPSSSGARFHAAKDWFAPAGTPVRAPVGGTVIVAVRSDDSSGQVFGGVTKIQAADGKVWVMRHSQPTVDVGDRVSAGQVVATVHEWLDGPEHIHFEVWKSRNGDAQVFENMIDPMTFFRRFA